MSEKSDHDPLTSFEAAKEIGISRSLILSAFKTGALRGRNFRGRKGWVTTRRALSDWIENDDDIAPTADELRDYREDDTPAE